MDSLATTLGDGTDVCLYGERALEVTAERSLLIADLHLGKEDLFRRGGISVPQGPTDNDLVRLTALIALSAPERLLVLGDFVHGAIHDAPWLTAWQRWRSAHRELAVVVVAGNHDRQVDHLAQPAGLRARQPDQHPAGVRQLQWLCARPARGTHGGLSRRGSGGGVAMLAVTAHAWHRRGGTTAGARPACVRGLSLILGCPRSPDRNR